jgi:uncharacterized protein
MEENPMRILDFHTHVFPDSLAARAVATLSEAADGVAPECDGTVAGLLRLMDQFGIEKAVLASIATKPPQSEKILEWSLQVRSEHIIPFASVHPDAPDVAGEVQRAAAAGLRGIKLHPLYQSFNVDDPRVFPLYDAIQESGLPLLIHAGYDIAFDEEDQAAPRRFVPVIANFPRLKMVMAHFGGWRLVGEFLETLVGKDVYIDTSFAAGYCTDAQVREMLARHDTQRIVFGSDAPWGGMRKQIGFVENLPTTDAVKERIFYGNAAVLLGD